MALGFRWDPGQRIGHLPGKPANATSKKQKANIFARIKERLEFVRDFGSRRKRANFISIEAKFAALAGCLRRKF